MSRAHGWFAICSSVIASSLCAHIVHAEQYSLIELDAPAGAQFALPLGINNNDQAVGQIAVSPASNYAALWDGTIATTLDLAGGIAGAAYAINDAGVIVGTTYTMPPNGGYEQRAILWNGGLTTLLPTLGGTQGSAIAVNQLGQVVGWTNDIDGQARAVLWDGATPTDLGYGSVRDINNLSQMVGVSSSYGATLWNGTTPTALAVDMEPVAINDAGAIVGNTQGYDYDIFRWATTAKLWSEGTVIVLAGPANYQYNTTARDINNAGQIVGYSENEDLGTVATLWTGTSALNLNTVLTAAQALHIRLTQATAINDLGHIVVSGFDSDEQQQHSYVLIPATSTTE